MKDWGIKSVNKLEITLGAVGAFTYNSPTICTIASLLVTNFASTLKKKTLFKEMARVSAAQAVVDVANEVRIIPR